MASRAPPLIVSRYAIYDRIAAGGMATVHLGRLIAEGGFSRTVAIKRLHAHLALDPDFVSMFLDEARLAARIRHPNVVQTLDVVVADGEVFLVMEYVEGESLACLMRILTTGGEAVPPSHATALLAPVLHGLHAAHEAKTDQGEPLTMVHRDVSPQNVLVGTDGVPRVLDFGVAKALGQSHATRDGEIKGKLGYMSPEQIEGRPIDRRTDVFAASVVLWEALTGRRLFKAENDAQVMRMVIQEPSPPPSRFAPDVSPELDAIILCGLSKDPRYRFSTAEQMADALEETAPPIPTRKLATWVQGKFGDRLIARANLLKEIESTSGVVPLRRGRADPHSVAVVEHLGGGASASVRDAAAPQSSDPDGHHRRCRRLLRHLRARGGHAELAPGARGSRARNDTPDASVDRGVPGGVPRRSPASAGGGGADAAPAADGAAPRAGDARSARDGRSAPEARGDDAPRCTAAAPSRAPKPGSVVDALLALLK